MNLTLGIYTLVAATVAIAMIARHYRRVAAPLIVGFVARSTFAFCDDLYWGLSREGDGLWWDFWARAWADQGMREILSHIDTGHELYKVYMALLYYYVGHSPLMIQVLNAFFGTLIIVVVWNLARFLGARARSALQAAWIIALFPSMILHSGMLLREVMITLPLIVGVYQLAVWHRYRRPNNAVKSGGAFLVSMAFHSGAFAMILALTVWLAGSWIKALASGRGRLLLRNSAALALCVGVVAFATNTGWGMSKFRRLEIRDLSSLAKEQDYGAKDRTAYLEDLRADNLAALAIQSPVRVVYFLFAPFPWMISGVRDVIGFADGLLFMVLSWTLLRGREVLRRNPTALLVVALLTAMTFTFALGVSNYGTAFRHRSKMLPMLVAVAAFVIPSRVGSKRTVAVPGAPSYCNSRPVLPTKCILRPDERANS